MSLRLLGPPRLSRATVDRAEPLRLDTERLAAGWSKAQVLVVDEGNRAPVRPAAGGEWEVVLKPAAEVAAAPPPDAVLLGEQDDVAYWAMRGRPSLVEGAERSAGGTSIGAERSAGGTSIGAERSAGGTSIGSDPSRWQDLRARGADLDATSAGLLVTAAAVLGWHDNARFCARDGSPTEPRNAGWMRTCERGHDEYPRTDPAIICLVHDGGSGDSARVLLGRQEAWPPGRYSVLAGFVEGGESLEACVRREVEEEVGVVVSDVRYLGSQAWPFPRSIMIGFAAVGDPGQPLRPADGEIADALWVTRAELRQALERGDWMAGSGDGYGHPLLLPGPVSIARSMLDSWAAAD